MSVRPEGPFRIAVLGGGISGLTVAFHLNKWGQSQRADRGRIFDVCVFESQASCGGYIRTSRENGFIVENGPNGLLSNEPATLQLIQELGLQKEVVWSKDEARHRYVYWEGQIQKVPTSPPALILSKFLSWKAKLRIFFEALMPPRKVGGILESLFDFVTRHFGVEVAEKLAAPMTIGIYGGDAKRLALQYAFPKIKRMETQFGSLIRAAIKMRNPNQPTKLMSFQNGMQTLIEALIQSLGARVRFNAPVESLAQSPDKSWIINGERFDYIVVSTPHTTWPRLFPSVFPNDIDLGRFPIAPIATVSIAFESKINFQGFGTLIARNQGPTMLGFLHPPDIFPGRAPDGKDLITTMWGGSFDPDALELSPAQLVAQSLQELKIILKQDLPPILRTWVWYHRPGIPQYNSDAIRIQERAVQLIEALPNVSLHSNFYGGVAINDCIRKSRRLAEKIAAQMSQP